MVSRRCKVLCLCYNGVWVLLDVGTRLLHVILYAPNIRLGSPTYRGTVSTLIIVYTAEVSLVFYHGNSIIVFYDGNSIIVF